MVPIQSAAAAIRLISAVVDVVIGGEGDDFFNLHGVQDVRLFGMGGRDTFNFLAESTVGGALIGSINGR
jgi:hypothetical protein